MANPFASARLIYRALQSSEDADFLHAMSSDPIGVANSSVRLLKPVSKKEAKAHYKKKTEEALMLVIICIPDPASDTASGLTEEDSDASRKQQPKLIPIGHLGMRSSFPGCSHHRSGMIGINILQPYQGKGYGTEAIEWLMNWGFQIAGLHRIEIGCVSWNHGARKLYERMSFIHEATKREALWYNGGWHDIIEFSMLEHEWRQSRGKLVQGKGKS